MLANRLPEAAWWRHLITVCRVQLVHHHGLVWEISATRFAGSRVEMGRSACLNSTMAVTTSAARVRETRPSRKADHYCPCGAARDSYSFHA